MMNILYITNIDISEKGAAANHIIDIIKSLKKQNCTVNLISASDKLMKVRYFYSNPLLWYPRFKGGWWLFQFQLIIYSIFNIFQQNEIIYIRLSPSYLISYFLKKKKSKKIIELNGLEVINHPHFKYMLVMGDIILVGTNTTASIMAKKFPSIKEKIKINSNIGVDKDKFFVKKKSECRDYLNIDDEYEIILNVSGFQAHHDFDTLISAFIQVNNKRMSVKLFLVGDGPRKKEIEHKYDELIKSGKLIMVGAVRQSELLFYIGAADVCVNSMYNNKLQQHGNFNAQKTYEYMACNRPVIESCSFEIEIPEWISDYVTCVPAEMKNELSLAFERILKNKEFFNLKANEARKLVIEKFSWATVSKNIIHLGQ